MTYRQKHLIVSSVSSVSTVCLFIHLDELTSKKISVCTELHWSHFLFKRYNDLNLNEPVCWWGNPEPIVQHTHYTHTLHTFTVAHTHLTTQHIITPSTDGRRCSWCSCVGSGNADLFSRVCLDVFQLEAESPRGPCGRKITIKSFSERHSA